MDSVTSNAYLDMQGARETYALVRDCYTRGAVQFDAVQEASKRLIAARGAYTSLVSARLSLTLAGEKLPPNYPRQGNAQP